MIKIPIPSLETIHHLTFVVSVLILLLTIAGTWMMVKRGRVRLRARLDMRSTLSSTGWEFEISNIGDIPVTLSQVRVSLYRQKKKKVLWDWYHVRNVSSGGPPLPPFRIEPRGVIKVRFGYHAHDVPKRREEIAQIDKQGRAYLLMKTDCGCFRCQKFRYKESESEKSRLRIIDIYK